MRALITGGAGFIGTNLIKRLKKEGHEVISIDNYYTGNKDNHQPDVEYLESDIREINFNELGTVDIIYHLAALARIQPSFDNPVECFDINATGTLKLVDYASIIIFLYFMQVHLLNIAVSLKIHILLLKILEKILLNSIKSIMGYKLV